MPGPAALRQRRWAEARRRDAVQTRPGKDFWRGHGRSRKGGIARRIAKQSRPDRSSLLILHWQSKIERRGGEQLVGHPIRRAGLSRTLWGRRELVTMAVHEFPDIFRHDHRHRLDVAAHPGRYRYPEKALANE